MTTPSKTSWKRIALWAFAIVDVIAIVLLWRAFREDPAPAPIEASAQTTPSTPSSQARSRPREPLAPKRLAGRPDRAEPDHEAEGAAEPELENATDTEFRPPVLVNRTMHGDTMRMMYDAASGCYAGQTGNARLELGYRLRIAGGRASVLDVTVTSDELGDSALRDCIVAAIGNLSWEQDGSDSDSQSTATISLLGLRKRQRGWGDEEPKER